LHACCCYSQLDEEARKAVATARRHQQQLESLEIRASRTTMPNRPMLRHEDLPNWKSQSIEEINWCVNTPTALVCGVYLYIIWLFTQSLSLSLLVFIFVCRIANLRAPRVLSRVLGTEFPLRFDPMTRTFAYELPPGVASPLAAAAPHVLRAAEANALRSHSVTLAAQAERRSQNASASPASLENQSALPEQKMSLDRKKSSMALLPEPSTCELETKLFFMISKLLD
jgi:hypothetical protein